MDTVHRDSQGDNSQAGGKLRRAWEALNKKICPPMQFQQILTAITVALLAGIVYADNMLVEMFLLVCFALNLLLHFVHQQLSDEYVEEGRKRDIAYFIGVLKNEKYELAAVRREVADTVKMFKLIERRHYSRLSPKKRTKALQ